MAAENLTTYIALFHHRDNAAAAIRDLEAAGFTRDALTVTAGANRAANSDAENGYGGGHGQGSYQDLAEIGVPEDDRKHLQEGLSQGGVVIALEGSADRADTIEKIFHEYSTKKIDEVDVAPRAAEAALPMANAESMVIPVTQEELIVGKRAVEREGVRVFRRIVEEPVSESVTLREERVVVDRRPVDRAVTDADLRSGDQVIELTETAEEAVVGKTSRVIEEVRVGKEATEHTETVRDSVRHTEVEVEEVAPLDPITRGTGY